MESITQHLSRQALPSSLAYKMLDYEEPLSFQDWKKSRTSIIPAQEYALYNQYLTDWYTVKKRFNNNEEQTYQARLSYLSLLKELQLFFTDEEKDKWYGVVNFNNNDDILNAIPFFAKKLKEIALYFAYVRKKLKNTKLQYNLGGTNTGFELEIQEHILNRYTKSEFNTLQIPRNIAINLPELDAIKKELVVKVEEIYDDFEYQDQASTLPVSAYFNLNDNTTKRFFETKSLNLNDDSWVFINTPELSGQFFNVEYNLDLAESYLKKYLGSNKHTGEIAQPVKDVEVYDISLKTGDNYFTWPYGVYKLTTSPSNILQAIPLTATASRETGNANTEVLNSDTIFVKTKDELQGAWLRLQQHVTEEKTVKAKFEKNTKTEFKFPYPGFGLSGIGMSWTGPGFDFLPEFLILKEDYKKLIETEYWNYQPPNLSIPSIKLQDTTLIDQKAYASNYYPSADKVTIIKTPPFKNELLYSGNVDISWLYKFTKTDIPIRPGSNTTIFWPYERIESEELPDYYSTNSFICNPTPITDIAITYQIASNVFEGADKIYKVKSVSDTIETATECAWLSGVNVLYNESKVITTPQPSLSILCASGSLTKFVWQGDNLTDFNNIFKPIEHQRDCKYLLSESHEHEQCSCKAVNFTPYGHPGASVEEDFNNTDIIVECNDFNDITTFDIAKWVDNDGLNYKQSLNFAWFKTNTKKGFYNGTWVTEINNGIPRLKKGYTYAYFRAKPSIPGTQDFNLSEYALRYKYPDVDSKKFVWVSATKQPDGTWSSDDVPSKMVLRERDIIIYSRPGTTVSAISGTTVSQTVIAENRKNIWANYDYISVANINDPTSLITQTVYVSYPEINFADPGAASNALGGGIPPVNSSDILRIKRWTLIEPSGKRTNFEDTETFSFTPFYEGIYNVEVQVLTGTREEFTKNPTNSSLITSPPNTTTGYTISSFNYTWSPEKTTVITFTNIPSITAVGYIQTTPSLTGVVTPQPGFVLNTNLYGWDYSTSFRRNINTPGARPFWAKGIVGRENETKQGSISDWGSPVRVFDNHNVITQPVFSDVKLEFGNYFEYDRKTGTSLFWNQPLKLLTEVNKKQWCELLITINDKNNFNDILFNNNPNALTVIPLLTPSSITLTNFVKNYPVTILYKAITPFTWSVTATPEIETYTFSEKDIVEKINAERPWNQFVNRFNSTSVLVPTLESIYTKKDTGGYFIPNNLGVSVYNAKDFTYTLNTSSNSLTSDFVLPDYFYGGRGNTKIENNIPYKNLNEDATWLKESFNSNVLAGNVNRAVAREYPKFIPYQTSTESKITKQIGTGIFNKKLSPWTGKQDDVWGDSTSTPSNAAGIFNANVWSEQHILKSDNKQVYNWATDIFGNQYSLLKNIKNVSPYDQRNITGELWVQKTSKIVEPAYKALRGIFDTYKGLSIYSELTGSGIRKIDVFFDTLYIETTGAVLFEKINYDYENDYIYSFVDSSHIISLLTPVSLGFVREFKNLSLTGESCAEVGDTWFFPEQKIVLLSICELSSTVVLPHLYELDIANETFGKVFPL